MRPLCPVLHSVLRNDCTSDPAAQAFEFVSEVDALGCDSFFFVDNLTEEHGVDPQAAWRKLMFPGQ